ncbi:MAG: hypothetical protein IK061_09320, partial [Desulfovibrio sp.]|nr:hypothetical protein [Desulfovibrio sp.]
MKATIFQDAQRGEGYGIIDIADFPGMSEIPPFVIQRLSDGLYLNEKGRDPASKWVGSRESIRPEQCYIDRGRLFIAIGPAVFNELDSLESYSMAFGTGQPFHLIVPETLQTAVLPSTGGVGAIAGQPAPDPADEAPVKVSAKPESAPEPAPEPEPEPAPQPQAPAEQRPGQPELVQACAPDGSPVFLPDGSP